MIRPSCSFLAVSCVLLCSCADSTAPSRSDGANQDVAPVAPRDTSSPIGTTTVQQRVEAGTPLAEVVLARPTRDSLEIRARLDALLQAAQAESPDLQGAKEWAGKAEGNRYIEHSLQGPDWYATYLGYYDEMVVDFDAPWQLESAAVTQSEARESARMYLQRAESEGLVGGSWVLARSELVGGAEHGKVPFTAAYLFTYLGVEGQFLVPQRRMTVTINGTGKLGRLELATVDVTPTGHTEGAARGLDEAAALALGQIDARMQDISEKVNANSLSPPFGVYILNPNEEEDSVQPRAFIQWGSSNGESYSRSRVEAATLTGGDVDVERLSPRSRPLFCEHFASRTRVGSDRDESRTVFTVDSDWVASFLDPSSPLTFCVSGRLSEDGILSDPDPDFFGALELQDGDSEFRVCDLSEASCVSLTDKESFLLAYDLFSTEDQVLVLFKRSGAIETIVVGGAQCPLVDGEADCT